MKKKYIVCLVSFFAVYGCTADRSWNFRTDYLSVDIDRKGYITSMKNVTVFPAREFSPEDRPSPLLSLYDSGKKMYHYPQQADYDKKNNVLTLSYPNGSVAEIVLVPYDKYLKLTLISLEPRNGVDCVQWGDYYTNINNLLGEIIGVARDTSDAVNYSIGSWRWMTIRWEEQPILKGMPLLSCILSTPRMQSNTRCPNICMRGRSSHLEEMASVTWRSTPTKNLIIALCTAMPLRLMRRDVSF